MRYVPENKSPLDRIIPDRQKNKDDRRKNYIDQREQIQQSIAEANQGRIQEQEELQRAELIRSLPTAIDPRRDFGSIADADTFLNNLQGQRDRTNNQLAGAPVGARPYQVSDNGRIDLNSVDPELSWLLGKESGGNPNADNPNSTAFGIGQLLKANREKYGAELGFDPNTTDVHQQWDMMMAYIRDRYGTVTKAKEFWEKNGWY